MDPILIKRFVKYNKSLVAVIGATLLIVLFLLVIAVVKYLDMVEANNEVNKMRDNIRELQDPRKNKVAVIEGNRDLVKKDYDTYLRKNAEIRPFIGHPYRKALDAMAKVMNWKNGEQVCKEFYDFYAQNNRERVIDRYKRFKMSLNNGGPKNDLPRGIWDKAIAAFAKEAQKVSFEPITLNGNVDDIFLQAIGFPREMEGRSVAHCQDIVKDVELKLNKYVLDKNVEIARDAAEFSLLTPGMANSAKIAESMQNMEIVGDLITRMLKFVPADRAKRYMKSVDIVKYNGVSDYPEDNKIKVYKYNIKFTGTMEALRKVIGELNSAIKDSRVYVLRNLKLSVPLQDDQAAVVIGLVEAPVLLDKDGKKIEIKFRDDSDKPYNERRDYGKILIGSNPFFEISMDLDYMILQQYDYQRR